MLKKARASPLREREIRMLPADLDGPEVARLRDVG